MEATMVWETGPSLRAGEREIYERYQRTRDAPD